MKTTVHLIDLLASATVDATHKDYVAVQPMTIRRQTRMCVFQHPLSRVTFPSISLGTEVVLKLGCGLKQACWDRVTTPVVFRVSVKDRRERLHKVFKLKLDVRPEGDGRRWADCWIDLTEFKKQTVTLIFETSVPHGQEANYCWAGWSNPTVEHETILAPRIVRKDKHQHVLLITSDALRADHLGCYGHPRVRTPALDGLARDGCLFTHARANSPCTLGSYATMLTGQYAATHGIHAEWGRIKPGLLSLPQHLHALGYHTVIAPSEAEVGADPQGMVRLFQEMIPCLAVPVQDGEIATRQFLKWLERRPDRPFFAWLQFFDTHPPATPPEPFQSMYYQGDPTDPQRAYEAEAVLKIRGNESLHKIGTILDRLVSGYADADLVERLQATAQGLTGKTDVGPDLLTHLKAFGPSACRGWPLSVFGSWLAGEVTKLRRGVVSPELVDWLRSTMELLRMVDAELVSWLDGVVDYRYPLAQYMGEVSYLDHCVQRVLTALQEQAIYDNTTLVFSSPHGEQLTENGVYFHHNTLAEQVIRVPVIFKAAGNSHAAGVRVGGGFDFVDLIPTILDAVGAPHPLGLAGVSRWRHVREGSSIPEHDSIAIDYHQAMYAVTRPPYVFLKALRPIFASEQWQWKPGDCGLYLLREPMDYSQNLIRQHPDVARAMEDRLDEWLSHGAYKLAA